MVESFRLEAITSDFSSACVGRTGRWLLCADVPLRNTHSFTGRSNADVLHHHVSIVSAAASVIDSPWLDQRRRRLDVATTRYHWHCRNNYKSKV